MTMRKNERKSLCRCKNKTHEERVKLLMADGIVKIADVEFILARFAINPLPYQGTIQFNRIMNKCQK